MIDGVVDAEEAVVDLVELFHLNGLVLGVMLLKVERELLFDFLCVDGSSDFLLTLVEHCQHSVVHIVVEQYDAFLGRADKVGNEGVGIEGTLFAHWRNCVPRLLFTRYPTEIITSRL